MGAGQQPLGDIETVDDYRHRHATYRGDAGLQSLTAAAPLIAIWVRLALACRQLLAYAVA